MLQVLGAAAIGQRDDAIGPARRLPLERGEHRGTAWTVVAVEDVAVRLVDHRGDARDHRREAADESGLRGVRVDDGRPLAPEQADELRERGQVGDRRDLASEGRNVDEPASAPARVGQR